MSTATKPHLLGIDDAAFLRNQHPPVPIVAVLMEDSTVVEFVAIASFAVDGNDATGFIARWTRGLRAFPSVDALVLGGITLAGLGVVDAVTLSRRLARPVLVVTRKRPRADELMRALAAAGLQERQPLVARAPPAVHVGPGLYLAHAGIDREGALRLLRLGSRKARIPEALRVAHLIGRALVDGASRGRA